MSSTPRRRFLTNVIGGTAALAAGTGALRELEAQGGIPTYPPPQGGWDMSWVERVEKARHKAVFDCAEVGDGIAITNAQVYMAGWRDVYGMQDADLGVALVIRHTAIPMVLDDAIWAKWNVGEQLGVKESGEPAKRNTFARAQGGRGGLTLRSLIDRGGIVLCCNLALMRAASRYASDAQTPVEDARRLFIESLVPGVIRQTNGIFAVTRAQEAGARLIKST